MKNNLNKISKLLLKKSFVRIIVLAVVYTLSLVGFVMAGMIFSSNFIRWEPSNPLYRILKLLESSLIIILPLALVLGYLVIVYIQLKKAYEYLDVMINAIELVGDGTSQLISLEYNELQEIQDSLNETKTHLLRNARAAKEAEQRKNDLVVYLAHDLKTPLTSVIGYLMLLRDENEISEKTKQHYLEITLDKAERLEELINEFFEITRFNLTENILEKSRVDMVRLFEQLTYEFKPMLEEKRLKCELHMPKQLEMICDVNKIQRVLDNLLRNAVNYSFEDTIIYINLEEVNEFVHISFQNNGNTIPPEKLNHLFEQFFRLDSSRTSKTGGAGLGLSISKAIIEQHHGTITVDSYDENIIFKVILPKE